MKTKLSLFAATAMVFASQLVIPAQANTFTELQNAVTNGNTNLGLRYRYEYVDQDGLDKEANASTLRTRLTWNSDNFKGFSTRLEVDNVAVIGNDNYNSTTNGNGQYPVVADPKGTDLNQAFVTYKTGEVSLSFGRQRIVHHNQRFVGGVAWRQNEQTFDGYRVQYDNKNNLSFDYSYIYNVNRIFGPTGNNADLDGNIHLLNTHYTIHDDHKLTVHAYDMDFDRATALSNRTLGLAYDGKIATIKIHAAYAKQADTGDNPIDYSANYWTLEAGTRIAKVNVALGFESLGSDNGKGFVTPLATLHKFQGFADKFLVTPASGIEDLYIKASTKFGKLALTAVWHDLSSEANSTDYGTELNLIAKYPLANKVALLLKYANYSADDFATDTDKFWTMLNITF